jgi:hypothetical protein
MILKDLIKRLQKLEEKDPEREVFLRMSNGIGNISSLEVIEDTTYGFFGKDVPCVILDRYKK